MLRFLFALILSFPISTYACTGYVIGFKGNNDLFDNRAFVQYVNRLGYCGKVYKWQQENAATKFVNTLQVPFQLYGYSKGAVTISELLKKGQIKKPEYVLTIGAYRTTDVDFSRYEIRYDNFFDSTGRGQKSPGVFLSVSHSEIQKEVNRLLTRDK